MLKFDCICATACKDSYTLKGICQLSPRWGQEGEVRHIVGIVWPFRTSISSSRYKFLFLYLAFCLPLYLSLYLCLIRRFTIQAKVDQWPYSYLFQPSVLSKHAFFHFINLPIHSDQLVLLDHTTPTCQKEWRLITCYPPTYFLLLMQHQTAA